MRVGRDGGGAACRGRWLGLEVQDAGHGPRGGQRGRWQVDKQAASAACPPLRSTAPAPAAPPLESGRPSAAKPSEAHTRCPHLCLPELWVSLPRDLFLVLFTCLQAWQGLGSRLCGWGPQRGCRHLQGPHRRRSPPGQAWHTTRSETSTSTLETKPLGPLHRIGMCIVGRKRAR